MSRYAIFNRPINLINGGKHSVVSFPPQKLILRQLLLMCGADKHSLVLCKAFSSTPISPPTTTHSHIPPSSSEKQNAAAKRITWIGIYSNVLLSGMKGVAGISCNSAGLIADCVHSISDLLSDGVTLAAVSYCSKPADKMYPYGYGKYENIGTLAVASLLTFGAFGIVFHSAEVLFNLLNGPASSPDALSSLSLHTNMGFNEYDQCLTSHVAEMLCNENGELTVAADGLVNDQSLHPAALGVAASSVVVKEALYRATIRVGRQIDSSVLIANAWHHRSDALTSIVALGGIGMSLAGFPLVDPLAGFLVGGLLLKTGAEIGIQASKELADVQLPPKVLGEIQAAVLRVGDGNRWKIHKLRARRLGRIIQVEISIYLVAEPPWSLGKALDLKKDISQSILHQVPAVKKVIVDLRQDDDN